MQHRPHPRRTTEVRVEIWSLEDALVMFKVTYGVEPPSGVVLYPDQEGWDRDRRNKGLIRQLWLKFDFTNCGGLKNVPSTRVTLSGAESLVFFLGGVAHPDSGQLIGFARDPVHPFAKDATDRDGPFFEFKGSYDRSTNRWIGRLIDQDHDGFPEYLDSFSGATQPYLYVSSYGGKGYRVEDLGGAMKDVYRDASGAAIKPKGIQIISAGKDGKYGSGGLFEVATLNEMLVSGRLAERDNLTNFSPGTLVSDSESNVWPFVIAGFINVGFLLLAIYFGKPHWSSLVLLVLIQFYVTTALLIPLINSVR